MPHQAHLIVARIGLHGLCRRCSRIDLRVVRLARQRADLATTNRDDHFQDPDLFRFRRDQDERKLLGTWRNRNGELRLVRVVDQRDWSLNLEPLELRALDHLFINFEHEPRAGHRGTGGLDDSLGKRDIPFRE